MMRIKSKRLCVVALALLLAACALCFLLAAPRGTRAYDKLPEDVFGAKIGSVTLADGTTCVNYARGYALYAEGVTPAEDGSNAVLHRSGINKNADGTETRVDVEKMLEVVAKSGTADSAALRDTYGPGWGEEALTHIREQIAAKYRALYVSGFNPGVSLGIDAWDNVAIKEDFRYGDGTTGFDAPDAGGRSNMTTIAYSPRMDAAFAVTGEVWKKYAEPQACRRLGAPVADAGRFTLSGTTGSSMIVEEKEYEGQVFETGALIKSNNGDYVEYVGAVEQTGENAYVLHPWINDQDIMARGDNNRISFIGDLDGVWHPLKSAAVVTGEADEEGARVNTMYANFKGGCVEVRYDGEDRLIGAMRYAGYNFVKDNDGYKREKLPLATFASDEYLWEINESTSPEGVEAKALSAYRSVKENGTVATLQEAFRAAYEALYNEGFVAGYRSSPIKVWDLIVLDFKFGDGAYGFDATGTGKRERMTVFVYSPSQDKVYPVYGEYFQIFKRDSGIGRKVLGAPASGVQKNATLAGRLFEEIQCYENGYIYKAAGSYHAEIGYRYDAEKDVFAPVPAPDVPGNYGAKRNERTENGTIYINYEYGAVAAKENAFANGYLYTYYPGRNIGEDGKVSLLDMDNFMSLDKLTGSFGVDAEMAANFEKTIKNKIYAKYKKLFDSGVFPGFMEGSFSGSWNSCYAQQLIHGDSTAKPFGEERAGVSALIYNPADGEVYFLTGAFMTLWASGGENAKFTQLRVPTSDAYEKGGYTFQNFQGNQAGRSALAVLVGGENAYYYTDGTTADGYLASVPKVDIPTHNDKYDDGYVGYEDTMLSGGCGAIAPTGGMGGGGTAALLVSGAAVLAAGVLLLKKKCLKKSKRVS